MAFAYDRCISVSSTIVSTSIGRPRSVGPSSYHSSAASAVVVTVATATMMAIAPPAVAPGATMARSAVGRSSPVGPSSAVMPRMAITGFDSLIVIIAVVLAMDNWPGQTVHPGRCMDGRRVIVLWLSVVGLLLHDRDVKLIDDRAIVGVTT